MYERFFGLEDAPFRLTPDPRYLFLSRKHQDALAHLKLGLTESGFVCITGDVGTGKTTLLRHFLASLGPEVSAAYIFNPALSATELLQTVNAEFGLAATSTSRKELVDLLNAHLLRLRSESRRAVVVVDEAQALDIDVLEQLRLLSNLETPTEKLLRIILVGQPQLRRLLLHPELVQLNQRITLRWHIGPLSKTETSAYVRHRLSVASQGKARELFTRHALALVHQYSGGVPRLINMIAHRSLLAAFAGERRRVAAPDVRKAYREVSMVPLPAPPRRRHLVPVAVAAVACLAAIGLTVRRLAPPHDTEIPPVGEPPPSLVASATIPAVPTTEPTTSTSTSTSTSSSTTTSTMPADERLGLLDAPTSFRGALGAVASAWHVDPPAEVERSAADLPHFADRRGLEYLPITGNLAMLRLLDVPAVLELRFPTLPDTRYATLVALAPNRAVLAIAGERLTVEPAFFDRYWYGRAHVFSRDFEGLGPGLLGEGARGLRVTRLQSLLARTGLYDGGETGTFNAATRSAITAFQRSRYIEPDGQLGRLTRMVLYAAVGGYERPTLAGGAS